MVRLLKCDWKLVGMTKDIITNLVHHLQPVVMALKKIPNNWANTFLAISQYWRQALYNQFENIDKAFGFNKFFLLFGDGYTTIQE